MTYLSLSTSCCISSFLHLNALRSSEHMSSLVLSASSCCDTLESDCWVATTATAGCCGCMAAAISALAVCCGGIDDPPIAFCVSLVTVCATRPFAYTRGGRPVIVSWATGRAMEAHEVWVSACTRLGWTLMPLEAVSSRRRKCPALERGDREAAVGAA